MSWDVAVSNTSNGSGDHVGGRAIMSVAGRIHERTLVLDSERIRNSPGCLESMAERNHSGEVGSSTGIVHKSAPRVSWYSGT
jgi:hypothetical protein